MWAATTSPVSDKRHGKEKTTLSPFFPLSQLAEGRVRTRKEEIYASP